jgi:hypothetical protein
MWNYPLQINWCARFELASRQQTNLIYAALLRLAALEEEAEGK